MYELAVELAPTNYSILTEVGNFYGEQKDWKNGERLLLQAIETTPQQASAYRLWAGQLIHQERYRDAHRMALSGLAAAGADRELFGLLSETYVAKGDFEAAIRARRAAAEQTPGSVPDLERLSEVYRMAGDTLAAEAALRQANDARLSARPQVEFTPEGRIVQRASLVGTGAGQ